MKKWIVSTILFVSTSLGPAMAHAGAPMRFGHGARSMGLARADIASPDATSAPIQNASFAADPGTRVRLGYMEGAFDLRIDDHSAKLPGVDGFDGAAQIGLRISRSLTFGFALAAHVPNAAIAEIGFRPGTEPQFFRYESVLQRATFDLAFAAKWGPVAFGAGAAFALDMGGTGTTFSLGQDAHGTYADAASDINLEYRATPIVGLSVHLGRVSFGATYRGAMAVGLAVDSDIRIALAENPLNGTTTIAVRGASGYDPARFGFGTKAELHRRFFLLAAMEWERHKPAPSPVAYVELDVNLGTSPGRTEVEFVNPQFRDVLVPRIGIEWTSARGVPGGYRSKEDSFARWAVRSGYAFMPSPVPPQTGFTSYADCASHIVALGGGIGFGRFWGVDLRVDAAAQASFLAPRTERKSSSALPHATYEVTGKTLVGSVSIEGTFQ